MGAGETLSVPGLVTVGHASLGDHLDSGHSLQSKQSVIKKSFTKESLFWGSQWKNLPYKPYIFCVSIKMGLIYVCFQIHQRSPLRTLMTHQEYCNGSDSHKMSFSRDTLTL